MAAKSTAASSKKSRRSPMSDEHKAALAEGREQGRAVRQYLEALESTKPKRGRKRTPDSIAKRLEKVEDELRTADPLKRLQLTQERIDLQAELDAGERKIDMAALEAAFVRSAKGYSQRKGISYTAWRQAGVGAPVLKKAGISRSM